METKPYYWEKVSYSKLCFSKFKDTLKVFNDFENSQKSVWSNVFWYVKLYIFWKCIQYTIHWHKTQIFEKLSLDKINGTKNTLIFLLQAPNHHSFTFNLWFSRFVSLKLCMGFSIFNSVSFLLKFIFLLNKMHGPFGFKTPWFLSKLI